MNSGVETRMEDALWSEVVLKPAASRGICIDAPREVIATALIIAYRAEHAELDRNGDIQGALNCLAGAKAVWQLSSAPLAGWILGAIPSPTLGERPHVRGTWEGNDQAALRWFLDQQMKSLRGQYNAVLDPVAVLFPRWLMQALSEALEALRTGEIQQIIQPGDRDGKHDLYSADRLKLRAVEHVVFRKAKGIIKDATRKSMGSIIGVKPATISKWEGEYNNDGQKAQALRAATQAGTLQKHIEDRPSILNDNPDILANEFFALAQSLQNESLEEFGRRCHRAGVAESEDVEPTKRKPRPNRPN